MDVQSILRNYIRDNFLLRKDMTDIGDDDPLLESGIVDSIGIVQFASFLESTFDIVIDDEDIVPENFETMASIAAFVDRQRGQVSP